MRAALLCTILTAMPAIPAVQPAYGPALAQAQHAVAGCRALAAACDPVAAPRDLLPPLPAPALRFDWLRTALAAAQKAAISDRAQQMQQASERLRRAADGLAARPGENARPQALARTLLAQRQFRFADVRPSWWQLLQARFWAWIDRVLENAANAAEHRPWLGLLVEWGCLVAALSGIAAYLLNVLRRDRLRLQMPWSSPDQRPQEDRIDWAALTEQAAASGQWREAIHATYWGAIAQLTAKGRWRPGAARTPREYLRLLEPASDASHLLAALTRALERAWYANQPTTEQQFQGALRDAQRLAGASVAAVSEGAA